MGHMSGLETVVEMSWTANILYVGLKVERSNLASSPLEDAGRFVPYTGTIHTGTRDEHYRGQFRYELV